VSYKWRKPVPTQAIGVIGIDGFGRPAKSPALSGYTRILTSSPAHPRKINSHQPGADDENFPFNVRTH